MLSFILSSSLSEPLNLKFSLKGTKVEVRKVARKLWSLKSCRLDSRSDLVALSLHLPPQLGTLLFQLVDLDQSAVVVRLSAALKSTSHHTL